MFIKAIDSNNLIVLLSISCIGYVEELSFPDEPDGVRVTMDSLSDTIKTVDLRVDTNKLYEALDDYSEFGYCKDLTMITKESKIATSKVFKLAKKSNPDEPPSS